MAYGLNAQGGTPEQQTEQQRLSNELGARTALNKQQQTQYAAKNMMNVSPNQMAVAGQKTAQTGTAPLGTATSPVTADGKINEANTPQPPPPPPQPAPPPPVQVVAQPPQQTVQQQGLNQALVPTNQSPNVAAIQGQGQQIDNGGIELPNGANAEAIAEMMRTNPTSFPTAADAQAWGERYYGWGPAGTGTTGPGGTSSTSWKFGQSFGAGGMDRPPEEAFYRPGELPNDPNQVYGGSTYDQWTAPDQAGQNQLTWDQINRGLTGDVVDVNLLNARSQDAQSQALKDVLQQQRNNAGARGMLGGGFATGLESRTSEDSAKALLEAQRNNRIDAATKNQDYRNTAIDQSEAFRTGVMNRADTSYGNRIKGQATQALDRQQAIGSANEAKQAALELALKREGLKQLGAGSASENWRAAMENLIGGRRNDITEGVGMAGVGADRYRTQMQGLTDLMRIMAGVEDSDKGLGLDYTRLFSPQIFQS